MPLELITNRNMSEGMQVLFVYSNDITGGLFIKLLIFAIWACTTFGLFFAMKRTQGDANFPGCMAVGGFITAIASILMKLIPGLLDTLTFTIVIVVAIVSILFFLFSRD